METEKPQEEQNNLIRNSSQSSLEDLILYVTGSENGMSNRELKLYDPLTDKSLTLRETTSDRNGDIIAAFPFRNKIFYASGEHWDSIGDRDFYSSPSFNLFNPKTGKCKRLPIKSDVVSAVCPFGNRIVFAEVGRRVSYSEKGISKDMEGYRLVSFDPLTGKSNELTRVSELYSSAECLILGVSSFKGKIVYGALRRDDKWARHYHLFLLDPKTGEFEELARSDNENTRDFFEMRTLSSFGDRILCRRDDYIHLYGDEFKLVHHLDLFDPQTGKFEKLFEQGVPIYSACGFGEDKILYTGDYQCEFKKTITSGEWTMIFRGSRDNIGGVLNLFDLKTGERKVLVEEKKYGGIRSICTVPREFLLAYNKRV